VPLDWEESDPRYITGAADVKLRAFSTKVKGMMGRPQLWKRRGESEQPASHLRSVCLWRETGLRAWVVQNDRASCSR
jgi:hypothetical protein